MKNSKLCPKCGSNRVLLARESEMSQRNILPMGMFDYVEVDRWVCCGCGYSEEWVNETELDLLEQYWSKRQK